MTTVTRNLLGVVALAMLAACASGTRGSAGIAPGLAGARDQVSDRFMFGRAMPSGGMVSDSAWQDFLQQVVTPRFPEGFTVWRTEGQWLDPRGVLVKEPGFVLEVIHPKGVPADSVFERVATEYRVRFRQDAVFRATTDARVWLYEQRSGRPY
jgi:hypothetical protein